MSVALLVGMKYQREPRELPGIVLDLYRIYQLVQCWASEVYVLTDITEDESIRTLRSHIFEGQVNPDIIYFIREIKERNQYISYVNRYTFLETLQNICRQDIRRDDRIFFYYTGHGEQGNLILPSNELLTCRDLQSFALANLPPNAQMITILDCCNASTLGLPYKLTNNIYRLTPRSGRTYPMPEIICITSTTPHQNSITSKQGSLFSIALISELQKGTRDLRVLLNAINSADSRTAEYLEWVPSDLQSPGPPPIKSKIRVRYNELKSDAKRLTFKTFETMPSIYEDLDSNKASSSYSNLRFLNIVNRNAEIYSIATANSNIATANANNKTSDEFPNNIFLSNTIANNNNNNTNGENTIQPFILRNNYSSRQKKQIFLKGDKTDDKYKQTAMIYSSKPNLTLLWSWIFNRNPTKINYDLKSQCLTIDKNKPKKIISAQILGVCLVE